MKGLFLLVNVHINKIIKDLQKPIDLISYFKNFPAFDMIRQRWSIFQPHLYMLSALDVFLGMFCTTTE